MGKRFVVSSAEIDRAILFLRGKRVMLDVDLAIIFGTSTKRLNEQVRRNLKRFPPDFLFQLTYEEKDKVVAICDHLENLKYSRVNPYAFTEHGAIMAATILNTPVAVEASIAVVRAFVKLRKVLLTNKSLARKIAELETKYDHQFKVVFDAIRKLMQIPGKRNSIGYKINGEKD